MRYSTSPPKYSPLAQAAEKLVYLSAPLLVIGVLVTRSGKIEPLHGIAVFIVAAILAVAALAVAGVAAIEMWQRGYRGLGSLMRVGLVAMVVLAYPGYLTMQAIRLPPLNDISTDREDAPGFSRSRAALAARQGHVPATLEPRQRAAQLRAYPELRSLILDLPAEEVFQLVRDAVENIGWVVIDDSPPTGRSGQGRLDAVATSRLMGFKEDITIRVRAEGAETRVDVRSVSRLGKHDFGINAARITRFFEEMKVVRE